jgi:hypothetical protein
MQRRIDRVCQRFEPEGKMGIVPDEVLLCVFYCSANYILQ